MMNFAQLRLATDGLWVTSLATAHLHEANKHQRQYLYHSRYKRYKGKTLTVITATTLSPAFNLSFNIAVSSIAE